MNNIFKLIPPAVLARLLKVSRQRAHVMCKNLESGDNERRVNEALKTIRDEIDNHIQNQK